jgi:hypothetical protein
MEQSNRIERRERLRGWERTGQEDCRPGTDSTKAETRLRGATVATAEAEAATDHWDGDGERMAWASANERADVSVTAEQVQCSAVQWEAKRMDAGSGQRAASRENAVQCRRGQRNNGVWWEWRRARGGEGARW